MRQIVLDTETTGLNCRHHCVVEIGAVELLNRRVTGQIFHHYLKPHDGCEFEAGAQQVTGLTQEFLADKPRFGEIADAFCAFIDGAELIIHNAPFDLSFLDTELQRLGQDYGSIRDRATVLDTLLLARDRYPGQRNSLDALCKRLGIDHKRRKLHGALIDAQLLAEVYLSLTCGQQEMSLAIAPSRVAPQSQEPVTPSVPSGRASRPTVDVPAHDRLAHEAILAALRERAGRALWDEDAVTDSDCGHVPAMRNVD